MKEDEITSEMVRSRLLYVRTLGRLVWLRSRRENFQDENKWSVWNARYAGHVAGSVGTKGYRSINIFDKMRKSSRLTWVYHYGYWPNVIDHIDGDTENDEIDNLRDVTQSVNCRNRVLSPRNSTGTPGVFRDGKNIRAQISVAGKNLHLGSFGTIEEAVEARKLAEERFGYHPNNGRARAPEMTGGE